MPYINVPENTISKIIPTTSNFFSLSNGVKLGMYLFIKGTAMITTKILIKISNAKIETVSESRQVPDRILVQIS